jgi:CRP-like cAMP-binding protein
MANPDNEALLSARLFQSSNPEVGRRLAGLRLRARAYAPGEAIFEAGEPADCVGGIESIAQNYSAASILALLPLPE